MQSLYNLPCKSQRNTVRLRKCTEIQQKEEEFFAMSARQTAARLSLISSHLADMKYPTSDMRENSFINYDKVLLIIYIYKIKFYFDNSYIFYLRKCRFMHNKYSKYLAVCTKQSLNINISIFILLNMISINIRNCGF